MDKKKIAALVIIALVVVILVINRGGSISLSLPLISDSVSGLKSLVLLAFTGVGVVIGILLSK